MNDQERNEYLQTELFGECIHQWDGQTGYDSIRCKHCGFENYSDDANWNRDFSTDTDYCALEDKFMESGEIMKFETYMAGHPESLGVYGIYEWLNSHRSVRAALIAEYWQQR